jgi:hypothetical protein
MLHDFIIYNGVAKHHYLTSAPFEGSQRGYEFKLTLADRIKP